MQKKRYLKNIKSLVAIALVLCMALPATMVFAAASKWVEPATAASYKHDTDKSVIEIRLSMGNWGTEKFENTPVHDWWLKNHNIKLIFDLIPGDNYQQDLIARIAAKTDVPDVFIAPNRGLMYQWASQGVTINDLTGVINDYMPTYSQILDDEDLKTAKTEKGAIVGVPFRPSPIDNVWMVRKDWLDALNLQVPKTFEDIYKIGVAFTKNDPDKNGKNDTYAFNEWGNQMFVGVTAAYGVSGTLTGVPNWHLKNNKLVWALETQEFKNAVTWYAKAVSEGLFYPDWSNQEAVSYDQFGSAMASNKFGIFPAASWWIADPWNTAMKAKAGNRMEWISVPNIRGVDGQVRAPQRTPVSGQWFVLNSALKNEEAKLIRIGRFLDQLMSAPNEGYLVTFSGVQKDGTPTLGGKIVEVTGGNLAEDQTDCWWFTKNFTYASVRSLDQSLDQVQKGKQLLQADPRRLLLQLPARKQTRGVDTIDPFFDLTATQRWGAEQQKFISASLMGFLTGNTPMAEWDKFVDTVMKKYNGNRMKDIYLKQLQNQGFKVTK